MYTKILRFVCYTRNVVFSVILTLLMRVNIIGNNNNNNNNNTVSGFHAAWYGCLRV